jgi:hypothetical protein
MPFLIPPLLTPSPDSLIASIHHSLTHLRRGAPTSQIIPNIRHVAINNLQLLRHIRTMEIASRRISARLRVELVELAAYVVPVNALRMIHISITNLVIYRRNRE